MANFNHNRPSLQKTKHNAKVGKVWEPRQYISPYQALKELDELYSKGLIAEFLYQKQKKRYEAL